MSDETQELFWDEMAMATDLSDREKELRDKFVEEYMNDFNPYAACIRIGFLESMASDWGSRFMGESYVRKQIALRMEEQAADPKAEAEATKRKIRAMLMREANYTGIGSSHAARVAATAKLAAFYGMDAPTVTKLEHMHRGGVMEVPGIASPEDWQKAAMGSQEKLLKDSEV